MRSPRNALHMSISIAFAFAMAMAACGHAASPDAESAVAPDPVADQGPSARTSDAVASAEPEPGFDFALRRGEPEPDLSATASPPASSTLLPEAEATALMARLPALAAAATDVQAAALRDASRPPPRTGVAVTTAFPPLPTIAAPAASPASAPGLLRWQPDGDVPFAPRVTLTFATPMVAVTSHDALASGGVPATLTPAIDGVWRWVGAKTLLFDPAGRAPMATTFTVSLQPGLKDALGQPLPEARAFTFQTPPPRAISSEPSGDGVTTDPVLRLVFDQRVDPATLAQLVVSVGGDGLLGALASRRIEVRSLTAAEREAERTSRRGATAGPAERAAEDARVLTFKAVSPLPTDAKVTIVVPPGFPSAEGPRLTTEAQTFAFRTYGALKVRSAGCGWGRDCKPGMPFLVALTNPLDPDRLDPGLVTVEPALPGLSVDVFGSSLRISGRTTGRTTYTVRLAAGLADVHGQTLAASGPFTWSVEAGVPELRGPPAAMTVLEPGTARRSLTVQVRNLPELEVRLHKVTPADWAAWQEWRGARGSDEGLKPPPGREVVMTTLATHAPPETLHPVEVDLSGALDGDLGHVIAVVSAPSTDRWERQRLTSATWVQSTRLGLDAFWDGEALVAWATRLTDGTPAAGVGLALLPGMNGNAVKSDARGLARLPLPASGDRHALVVATDGADVAILADGSADWDGERRWQRRPDVDTLRWLTFTDRHLYRPGETVSLKGALRLIEKGPRGDLGLLPAGPLTRVRWRALDSRHHEIAKGDGPISALGTFDLQFTLPPTPNLGFARLELATDAKVDRAAWIHGFEIKEFRRPEFEVAASASEGPHLVGQGGTVHLRAGYFAGGPLAGAPVTWTARARMASFTPPNAGDFTFGRWVPWWGVAPPGDWNAPPQTLAGQTDATGAHVLGLDFLRVHPPRPVLVSAEATVADVNRQTWSTTATLLVHPSETLVGLRTASLFTEPGAPIAVDAVATDLSGGRVAGRPLTVRFARLDWRRGPRGRYVEVEADAETCAVTSAAEPVTCRHAPREGGRYRIVGRVVDARGRPHESELTVWVPGGMQPLDRGLAEERVTLVPTRRVWEPGETAEILVQAPFSPATGVALVIRGDVAETIPLDLPKGSATLRVPVADWMVPGVVVRVQVNGSRPREPAPGESTSTTATRPPRQPAFASAVVGLDVATTTRRLAVRVTPAADRLEPGARTSIAVTVRDHAGRPVAGTEVAVLVVDEAVLALSGHQHPDPVLAFYQTREGRLTAAHSRADLLLATEPRSRDGEVPEREGAATGGKPSPKSAAAPRRVELNASSAEPSPLDDAFASGDGASSGPAAIEVRSDFNPLAVFAPAVTTDAEGRVSVPVTLPDTLTRYRVVAFALAGARLFGRGEAAITARLPLMVRVSAPRFLNYSDRFELPVTVQNQTDAPLPVALVVRAANANVEGPPGRAVTVPPNDRVEVRVPVAAASAGVARLQVGVTSGRWQDAAEVSLPVWTPATTEAFATYGELDQADVRQPVRAPDDVLPGFGGLDIETSSTQLQALTDAVLQLATYPYGCAEQIASRMMSLAALRDVLAAFRAAGLPSGEALASSVSTDLARLGTLQGRDGGFAFWRRDGETWPFLTAHVAHALVRVRDAGYTVPGPMLERALGYLKNIRKHLPEDRYGPAVSRGLEAFALYVRQREAAGRDGSSGSRAELSARAQALLAADGGPEQANLELIGWLYPILSALNEPSVIAPVRRALLNRVSETAGAAHFTTRWQDGAWLLLHSERRVDALLLEGLIADQPDSDLIPKLVRGLLAHRTRGTWQSTQESSWVLLALNRYFRAYEATPPSFIARAWLGERFAGEHAFRGRTTERHAIHVPMADLAAAGATDLTLGKEGAGRLYYRVGLRYAPASLTQAPADHGFHVERTYEAVDAPGDVTREADGRWVFRAGARVRVKVLMHTEDRRYHVALVDPLPAGLEPLNPELRGTQAAPEAGRATADAPGSGWRRGWRSFHGPWYEHDNLRDERAEAFAALLPEGVHRYTYLARATTPGSFLAPAPKAEEMYAPETFGRGASDRVLVR